MLKIENIIFLFGAFAIFCVIALVIAKNEDNRLKEQFIELLKLDPSKEKLEKPMNLWCIQLPENVKIKEDK